MLSPGGGSFTSESLVLMENIEDNITVTCDSISALFIFVKSGTNYVHTKYIPRQHTVGRSKRNKSSKIIINALRIMIPQNDSEGVGRKKKGSRSYKSGNNMRTWK